MVIVTSHPDHSSSVSAILAVERRREAVRAAAHAREARRYEGVAWSGFAPEAYRPRTAAALETAAAAILARRKAWREGTPGRILSAVAMAQSAAESAHAAGEAIRAALSRDAERELDRCAQMMAAMEAQGLALLAAARAAREALGGAPG